MKTNLNKNTYASTLTWLWLIIFAGLPILLILIISFMAQKNNYLFSLHFSWLAYQHLFSWLYLKVFVRSFGIALITTGLCLLLGYPCAYILARSNTNLKPLLLLMVIVPFWTSSLLRSYAIMILLDAQGLLNRSLINLGLIKTPLHLLYSHTAVLIGLVYSLLPFMILPLYANLEKFDYRLVEAARDLGAKPFTILVKIILPLSLPGIISGSLLVMLPAMTLFYIPDLLGGAKSMLLGNLIQNEFLSTRNWPLGSAISISVTILMLLFILFFKKTLKQDNYYNG